MEAQERRYCPVCGKECFDSRHLAQKAMQRIDKHCKKKGSTYFCPDCEKWHITHYTYQSKKNHNQQIKKIEMASQKSEIKRIEEEHSSLIHEISLAIGNRTKLLYALALAQDVLANSIDQSLRALNTGATFSQDKKRLFGKLSEASKSVDVWYEKFVESSIIEASEDYNEYEGYRQDANELIRLMMLYLNATVTSEDYNKVISLLQAMQPEDKIFAEKEIERFNFIAKNRRLP